MTTDSTRSADMKFPHRCARVIAFLLCLLGGLIFRALAVGWWTSKAQDCHLYRVQSDLAIQAVTFKPGSSSVILVGDRKAGAGMYSEQLQVWDFRTSQLLFQEQLGAASDFHEVYFSKALAYVGGSRELLYCDGTTAHILDGNGYKESRQIRIGGPIGGTPKQLVVDKFAASSDGQKLAVLLRPQPEAKVYADTITDFLIRVYDVNSGKLEREWKFPVKGPVSVWGFALSPDGSKVAWTRRNLNWPNRWPQVPEMQVPPSVENLQILDVATGSTLGIHTGLRVEGEIAFTSNDRLLSISLNPALHPYRNDGIEIWDATTGKRLESIASPPNGVHRRLVVSADGQVLLGFVGSDKSNENFVDLHKQQFRLWDLRTWNVLFTSPPIEPVIQNGHGPEFRLNPDGHLVLVWWPNSSALLLVYEVPNVYESS